MDRFVAAMDARGLNCNSLFRNLLLVIAAFGLACFSAHGQVGSASLSGVVQDPGGAVIAGANVDLQNDVSAAQRASRTDSAGLFSFQAVPSGDYTLTVEQKGFKKLIRQSVHLNPGDTLSLTDLRLSVGEVTEAVSVSANASGLPLDNGQLSSTISAKDLDQLSVVGRDATELQRILPGFAIRNLGPANVAPDYTQVTVGQPTPYASNGAPVAGITIKLRQLV